jgi:hypothetical protein
MNFNIKLFLLCPIPDDQKPINQYFSLKENILFNVLGINKTNYFSKILINYILFFILITPFTFLFKLNKEIFLFNSLFSINTILIFFIINFVLWLQLLNQFRNARLFYEEGSWYDGQFWEKPIELIKNDKLIIQQKIKPIIKRIIKAITLLMSLNSLIFIVYS